MIGAGMSTTPEEVPALDELDGDELHREEYMGEFIDPSEDPNIQEHYDGE